MFKKIQNWVAERVGNFCSYQLPLFFVYGCMLYLLCSFVLFVIAWQFEWIFQMKPNLQIYIEYLKVITSPQTLAMIGWLCKMIVDANNNGIPDELEKETDNE